MLFRSRFLLNEPWAPIPNGLWSRLSGYRTVGRIAAVFLLVHVCLCMGRVLVAFDILPGFGSMFRYGMYVTVLCAVLSLVTLGYVRRRELRRFKTLLDNADYMMCWNCGYLLCGHPHEGCCPECSMPFRIDTLRDTWIQYILGNERQSQQEPVET